MSSRRGEVVFDDRRDREYSRRGEDRYDDREIEIKRSRGPREVVERERVEDTRVPAYVRNEPGRTSGPVVLRAREREDFEYAPRRRSPSREGETIIVRREREESRPRPPPPPEPERDEIIIRKERDVEAPRRREYVRAVSRERERSTAQRGRRGSESEDEIRIVRTHSEARRGGRDEDEIIIRHRSRSSSPARSERPPEPQFINAPQIHQEVITHHRHIDHGYEVAVPTRRPMSRPPSPPSPPRERSEERIAIHRSGERNGRPYHDDLVIDRRDDSRGPHRESYERPPPRMRPEEYPPSRESEEIIWRRSNGSQRQQFHEDELDMYAGPERYPPPAPMRGDIGGRFGRAKNPTDGLWTEITKDLVVKEAIEEMGYEYEETDDFYYVIAYLRYEDIVHLVGLSEDIRKDRRERVKQIEWENKFAPEPEVDEPPRKRLEGPPSRPKSPWNSENERYIEREIVYRGGRPPPPPGWRRG